jgi:hypothetical protein
MVEPKLIRKHRGATALKICGVVLSVVGISSCCIALSPDKSILDDMPPLMGWVVLLSGDSLVHSAFFYTGADVSTQLAQVRKMFSPLPKHTCCT